MLEFSCPRCGSAVVEEFYGPCGACRDVLRASLGRDAAAAVGDAVSVAAYEPKMNVTPNFLATKD